MPKFNVSLETLKKHRYIDGAIDDGIKLYEAGGVELVQDDPTYFRCIVPIPGKEHKAVALTYTDDCRDLKEFYCGSTLLSPTLFDQKPPDVPVCQLPNWMRILKESPSFIVCDTGVYRLCDAGACTPPVS